MHKVYKRDFVDMSKSNALFKRVVGGGVESAFSCEYLPKYICRWQESGFTHAKVTVCMLL